MTVRGIKPVERATPTELAAMPHGTRNGSLLAVEEAVADAALLADLNLMADALATPSAREEGS